jgi:hypothetical protein
MAEPVKRLQTDERIRLSRVTFGYPVGAGAVYSIAVGMSFKTGTAEGIVREILQLETGNLLATVGDDVERVLLSPPYWAVM